MIGIDRETLVRDLQRNVVKVTFNKKDGEERVMNCTLNMDRIEAADRVPKGTTNVAEAAASADQPVIRVLDTDLGEWRGFLFENVKGVEFVSKA